MDKLSETIKKQSILNFCLKIPIQAEDIAYVLYTSGSTGMPKGILISHENVVRLFQSSKDLYSFSMQDVWVLSHSFSFDFSVWEMWGALLYGGELILAPQADLSSPKQMNQLLGEHKVTVLNYTPSVFSQWVSELQINSNKVASSLSLLRLIFLGAESVANANLERWYNLPIAQQVDLFNLYGPTETTVYNTCHKIEPLDLLLRPIDNIGKPIAGKHVHILNSQYLPVPLGMVGEICVQGHGLSQGYLDKSDLTKEKFIEIKGADHSLIRLYRSGDLGRRLANGEIEYLGRCDQQVKLRGFRIELNAIKECLMQHERVDQAIVVMDETSQEKSLIAYVVPKPSSYKAFEVEFSAEHRKRWQALYDRVYAAKQSLENPWFNTAGWYSSYTGEAIAADAMQAWVDGTVERILKLSPKKVLEVGCGTGLLLSRIAPSTDFYHATDISEQAIDYIQTTLNVSPFAYGVLNLTCRPAHMISDDEKACYDLVIINSVVQYFPDIDYLRFVLSQALNSVKLGGNIFIGDVRSLLHLDLFHAMVLLSKETPTGVGVSLRQAIAQKHAQEAELLLDPEFFRQFASDHKDRISSVHIDIKSSQFCDEMAVFRYDVVLSLEDNASSRGENESIQWLNWETIQNLEEIAHFLQKTSNDYLAIKQIPNQRLYDLADFVRQSIDFPLKAAYVEWQRRYASLQGINPNDLYQIAKDQSYELYASWSATNPLSHFDVVFYKGSSKQILENFLKNQCKKAMSDAPIANNPLDLEDKKDLIRLLKKHLKCALPEYMHPQSIIVIDKIPTTVHRRIDFSALPKIEDRSILAKPLNELDFVEKKLVEIWQSLLSVSNIVAEDDFFYLGGHSLIAIQMLHAVEQIFSVKISINQLFGASSLSAFSHIIRCHLIDKEMQLSGIEYKPQKQSSIVILSSKGDKTPCFFFHPVGGTVFPYISLVGKLNPDHPYYAIQDPGIDAKQTLFASIEEMVSYYVKHIRAVQPHGPYLLAGASMGGTLALEAAAQLIKQGGHVEMIAMFDAWALFPENLSDKKRLEQGMMRQYEMLQSKLDKALIANPKIWLDINHHRLQLLLNYKPPIINQKVILFKCQELFEEFIPIDCFDNYWSQYTLQSVDVYKVSGNHETMMIEPHVKKIASVLNQLFAEKDKSIITDSHLTE